ncbi:MAG: ATP-binding cassette domain-containing protein [Sulfolobales archaeon]
MLRIKGLEVNVGDKNVVKNVDLSVGPNELHVIIGPNGSGKSTLLAAIMGLSKVSIRSGSIFFEDIDITNTPSYERAKLGIALAHQNPPSIRGVKLSEIVKNLIKRCGCSDYTIMSKSLRVDEFMQRDLFVGFSGGEKKRTELYLVMLQTPKLALLDEPDSGVDIESLNLIADMINLLIKRGSSIILVTHSGNILSKLNRIDRVHLMMGGRIMYSGLTDEVIPLVFKYGFRKTAEMLGRVVGGD